MEIFSQFKTVVNFERKLWLKSIRPKMLGDKTYIECIHEQIAIQILYYHFRGERERGWVERGLTEEEFFIKLQS